jgi:protein-disulfide isomerase
VARPSWCYKHFPLSGHVRAKAASIATLAAMEQGKFWEMHDIVFENQTALEDADIRWCMRRRSGSMWPSFDATTRRRWVRTWWRPTGPRAMKLDISGTPAVFVNGRYFNPLLFGGSVAGWIEDALRR